MAIREGRWDCSKCFKTRIKARDKKCPSCGDPRNSTLDPEEKPYLPPDAEEVSDPALLELANAGPDWNCGHCGEANRGDATQCANCSRHRDGDDTFNRVVTYLEGKSAAGASFDSVTREAEERISDLVSDDDEHEKRVSVFADEPDRPEALTLPGSTLRRDGEIALRIDSYRAKSSTSEGTVALIWSLHKVKIIAGSAILAAVLFIWAIYGAFLKTETISLEVQNLTWDRQVEVEAYRTLVEQDWHLPSDGRLIRTFRDVHHYDRVLDHYERKSRQVSEQVQSGSHTERYACGSRTVDRGNGFFETETEYCTRTVPDYETRHRTEYYEDPVYRDEPVYRTKYEYEIDRWVTDRWEIASGESGELGLNPYWPEPNGLSGNQRIGDERHEHYVVVLVDKEGHTFNKEPGYNTWIQLKDGTAVSGQITRGGDLRSVDWSG